MDESDHCRRGDASVYVLSGRHPALLLLLSELISQTIIAPLPPPPLPSPVRTLARRLAGSGEVDFAAWLATGYNSGMKYSLRSLMQFSIRDGLWLITVVALALALIYTKRPLTPPAPVPPVPIGRYELMSDPKSGYLFMLDSGTGEVWKYYAGEWTDGNSPAIQK
jgi:hypothetical protein